MGDRSTIVACMISYYFPPDFSGSAKQAISVANRLRHLDDESRFVSAHLGGGKKNDQVCGLNVTRLPIIRRNDLKIPSFWVSLAVFLVINRKQFDIIHAHGTIQHSIAGFVGRMIGKPTFLKIAMAQSDIAFTRQGRIWGRIQKFLVSRFDYYIATSVEIEAELKKSGVADNDQIIRIPNGVDTERFSRPIEPSILGKFQSRPGTKGEFSVLFVGIISARKSVDTVVKAFKRMRDEGIAGRLICVGPIPDQGDAEWEYYCAITEYISENGLHDWVEFTGYVEDPSDYYKAASIFVFPSKAEGMPNAVLEAIASGLPCIVANFSGAADMIRDGQEGWVIKASDVDEYTRRMIQLGADRKQLETMSEAARRRARDVFSLDSVAAKLKVAYSRSLAGKLHVRTVSSNGGEQSE